MSRAFRDPTDGQQTRPGRQALLVLAHLRRGDTYARLTAGLRVGIATVYRYIREAVDLLAALAPTLAQAMQTIRKKAYVILDGTLLPVDRTAADRPYYSRKKHHGMNVRVLADPPGGLMWVSDALPGGTHDLTAARTHGILAALAADVIKCWADKAYQGAGSAIRVPFRGKHLRGWRRRHNRDHANIRSLGERAMVILKSWRLLRKLRCSTTRITGTVRAVAALEFAS
ncbi:transposase family protein [Streptomyces seoulensis]|uniref:transposase family protein n=1 Tax=Streptomyces seoulensis TaxID=73044 RepID=UPI00204CE8D6|nr:IS5 family transposase [Streptomyces seoulensis]